jgi:protein O-mannosyl-transferase
LRPSFLYKMKLFWIALAALIGLTIFVYAPALHGPFLFDDFANLPALGNEGAITDLASFLRYITAGNADPTGRPVALLSFLIDANNWPAEPYPFKRTNLILHLVNGILLAILLRKLGAVALPAIRDEQGHNKRRSDMAAIVGAACWLLHPLFLSTTMYVVQREAMLPATTVLCGLIFWLRVRNRLLSGQKGPAVSAFAGIVLLTILGTLSKANGILLPSFIVALEYCFLRPIQNPSETPPQRLTLLVIGWIPTTLILGYLLGQGWHYAIHPITFRAWTIGERLLTEPRVLWIYLRELLVPSIYTSGLFNDQILVSKSILLPSTTLPAICGLTGLAALAIYVRKKYPPLALALVFFLAGHTIESTTIPLELYYEHRNYVPSLLLFWPLALWLTGIPLLTSRRISPHLVASKPQRLWLKNVAALSLVILLACMTHANAELWSTPRELAMVWARINPGSVRAQVNASQEEVQSGHANEAIARLTPLMAAHPDEVQVALNLVAAQCAKGQVEIQDISAAMIAMQTTRDPGSLLTSWFDRALSVTKEGSCKGLSYQVLDDFARSGINNHWLPDGRKQDLEHVRGEIALMKGDPETALSYFNNALLLDVRTGFALSQAAYFGATGHPEFGLRHLAYFKTHQDQLAAPASGMPRIHAWVLNRQGYWDNELSELQRKLEADANKNSASNGKP